MGVNILEGNHVHLLGAEVGSSNHIFYSADFRSGKRQNMSK